MSATLTHATSEGDRWDLLADTYYGDSCLMGILLRANPAHAHLAVLPAGLTLVVPVLEEDLVSSASTDYSPWGSL